MTNEERFFKCWLRWDALAVVSLVMGGSILYRAACLDEFTRGFISKELAGYHGLTESIRSAAVHERRMAS